MIIVFALIIGGLGYAAWRLSEPFTYRTPMFIILTGLLALIAGLLFKALFLL